jgi:hypothetical protein
MIGLSFGLGEFLGYALRLASGYLADRTSPDKIWFRQEVLKDCLNHPHVIRKIYQIPLRSIENKKKNWMGIFTRSPSGILSSARAMLEMFIGLLGNLRQIADENAVNFESQGFRRFFAMIQKELDDEFFVVVSTQLKELLRLFSLPTINLHNLPSSWNS